VREVTRWLHQAGVKTLFITKDSPWENGTIESAGGKLRDELLNRELFLSQDKVRWVIDRWRLAYNLQPKPTHHLAKATLVIYLFMTGGPAEWTCSIRSRS